MVKIKNDKKISIYTNKHFNFKRQWLYISINLLAQDFLITLILILMFLLLNKLGKWCYFFLINFMLSIQIWPKILLILWEVVTGVTGFLILVNYWYKTEQILILKVKNNKFDLNNKNLLFINIKVLVLEMVGLYL